VNSFGGSEYRQRSAKRCADSCFRRAGGVTMVGLDVGDKISADPRKAHRSAEEESGASISDYHLQWYGRIFMIGLGEKVWRTAHADVRPLAVGRGD